MNEPHLNIENLRNRVVNLAMIAFALFAVLSDSIAFIRALEYHLWSSFIIQTIAIAILVFTTIFRNKLYLNNQLKDRIEVKKCFTNEAKVFGNVGKLHQVFINILSNSIQAIEKDGEISITTYKQKNNIIIETSDTGVGISNINLTKITDPFYTTKDPGKGTGLGLSIAYSIIKDHSGTIEFQSLLNEGTIVKITLPNQ